MRALVADLRERLAVARLGGSESARAKHTGRGKLLVRDRVDRLLDPGSPFLELSALAATGMYDDAVPSAGIVTGIGRVSGRETVVVANDATVKGGTYYPMTVKKHLRAQAIAADNRLPCVYLVDSGGAFLPMQDDVFPDREHFGWIFFNQANLSARDLRDALGAEVGLVEEDPAEVLAVGEHLVLTRQEGTAGVDEVQTRQPVLRRNLLCAKVFLHGDRVVGAALDRGVVGHDHAFPARHPPDTGDQAGAGAFVVVHAVGGQRGEFQEGTTGIEQAVDPVARQQLAPADVALPGALRPAERRGRQLVAQLRHQGQMLLTMGRLRGQWPLPFILVNRR